MAVSKAQQRSVHKYVKENYDRLELTLPKGKKGKVKSFAEAHGESVNAFISRLINEAIEGSNAASVTPEASDVKESVLTVEAAKTAREAAELSGETVPAFVERAVKTQSERDKVSYRLNAKTY